MVLYLGINVSKEPAATIFMVAFPWLGSSWSFPTVHVCLPNYTVLCTRSVL